MKRQLEEAAERKRRENETRIQRFKRKMGDLISHLWQILFERIKALGPVIKNAWEWTKEKSRSAWKTHCLRFERYFWYGAVTLILVVTPPVMGLIYLVTQGTTPYDAYADAPTSSVVVIGDQCWLLYDQIPSEGTASISFDVGEKEINVHSEFENIRFKGSDWKAALSDLGHPDIDPDTCIKSGEVFK